MCEDTFQMYHSTYGNDNESYHRQNSNLSGTCNESTSVVWGGSPAQEYPLRQTDVIKRDMASFLISPRFCETLGVDAGAPPE